MKKLIILLVLLTISKPLFGQQTILWKITDTINNKTSTIVGTYHQVGNSFVDSIPEIKENLYNSELAIFESIDNINQTQKIINDREKSLEIKKSLKKKDYINLLEISKNWKVDIHKLKPIELRVKLQQEFILTKCKTVKQNDKWNHFDKYLQHLAEEKNIKILGLETDKEQLKLINEDYNSPSWKDAKKRISYLLNQLNRNDFDKNNCALVEKYKNYNLNYKFDTECKANSVMVKRNDKWMKTLTRVLREKNCFIAVGLLHLYNKCGLLEQLKSDGFIIEPIALNVNE